MSGRVLKHKRHYSPRRFPKTGRRKGVTAMTDERKVVFLGAVSVEEGETVAFSFPPNATPEAIAAALAQAEAERIAKQAAESQRLRALFRLPDETKGRS